MNDVSTFRLYLMRATYALILVGLAIEMWPLILAQPYERPLMNSTVIAMLTTVSLLAALGIRYPLKLLPLMFFELVWKTIWLAAVALPLWQQDRMDERTAESVFACALGVIFLVVIPWRYVWHQYVKAPSDRWR